MWLFFVIVVLSESFSIEPSPLFLSENQCKSWVAVARERGEAMKNSVVTDCIKVPGSSM